jgi:hypothetical protein
MSNREPRPPSDYPVGYGRPPNAGQFKPGQSGNPRGRPKGSRSVAATLDEIVGEKVPVTLSGKARRIPADEAMLRRLLNDALRGNPQAIKLLLDLIDRYAGSDAKLGNSYKTELNKRTVIVVPHDGRDPLPDAEQED